MQNEKTLQQMIQKYEAEMPPEIMNIIKSFDWKRQVRTIVSQNQLLLDVGADLEESVYLMILGVVEVEAVFERLMDVHQLPQDKVQKILTEVEKQIFEPMHVQLAKLDPMQSKTQSTPSTPTQTQIVKPTSYSIPSTPPANSQSSGVRESFSINNNSDAKPKNNITDTADTDSMNDDINIDVDSMETLDPVAMNLNKPTMSEPEPMPVSKKEENAPVEKKYAVDPYREPIE